MGIRCSSLQELNIFRFSHTLGEGVHAWTSGTLSLTNTERGNIYERLHKQFSLGTITNCKSEDAPWLQCPTDKALCNTTSLKKKCLTGWLHCIALSITILPTWWGMTTMQNAWTYTAWIRSWASARKGTRLRQQPIFVCPCFSGIWAAEQKISELVFFL